MNTKKTYYESGQLETEYNYKNNKLHGLIRDWYQNGQLRSEHNYKEYNYHGLSRYWNENGQLEYVDFYQEGKRIEFDGFLLIWDTE